MDGLGEGRRVIREQKGLDGETFLNLAPAFLLVGSKLETRGQQVLAEIDAAAVDDVNPFSGLLALLVEPRISDFSWRLFASPASAPVLGVSYLGGVEAPQLATRDGWNVLGVEYRVIHDFGAGVIGYRGAFYNAGTEPPTA